MFAKFFAAAALAGLTVVPAAAQDAPEEKKKEKKICRTAEHQVGSRLGNSRKVCKTAAEWQALADEARDARMTGSGEGVQTRD